MNTKAREKIINYVISEYCPSHFGYKEDKDICKQDEPLEDKCKKCWAKALGEE